MDIVNWLYLKKAELIKQELSDPEDLILLGADVSFEKRGDRYLSYAMPFSAFVEAIASEIVVTGITLRTNGVDNAVQNVLNLVNGTNVTITDTGNGTVTIAATAGGVVNDADNGLKLGTADTVYLAGTLLETTTIDVTDQYQLNIIGQNDQPKGEIVFIENSSLTEDVVSLGVNCDNGIAISATSTIGIAIDALS